MVDRKHAFVDSGHRLWDGNTRVCGICDMSERARTHELPPTPAAAKALDARRLGEVD